MKVPSEEQVKLAKKAAKMMSQEPIPVQRVFLEEYVTLIFEEEFGPLNYWEDLINTILVNKGWEQ